VVHPEDLVTCDVRPTTASNTDLDAVQALVSSTAYPVRRDQHYDEAVSLKIYRLSLMIPFTNNFFTNNFFCSST
jgi:hypothetical protein